jgi:predicted nucleic acid-binding protein
MMYIADTHALVWHLTGDDRLGKKAKDALRKADRGEVEVVIPTVVLAEALYISRKRDIPFNILVDLIRNAKNYSVYPLGLNVILEMTRLGAGYSIHDAVIVATAKLLEAPIITRDKEIHKSGDAQTIW